MIQEVRAIRITWDEVSVMIQEAVRSILGTQILCKAKSDDYNYWSTLFENKRMMMSEVFQIFEQLNASAEQRQDSLPEQEEWTDSVDCIGMSASSLLLSHGLRMTWKEEYISDDALWLLDVKSKVETQVLDAEVSKKEFESMLSVD